VQSAPSIPLLLEDDEGRERLLQTLTEACQKSGWQVHADCLMRNHFHLVVEMPQPRLVVGILFSALAAGSLPPHGPMPAGIMTISLTPVMIIVIWQQHPKGFSASPC
jgi:Transposase IS200 like